MQFDCSDVRKRVTWRVPMKYRMLTVPVHCAGPKNLEDGVSKPVVVKMNGLVRSREGWVDCVNRGGKGRDRGNVLNSWNGP